MVDTKKEIKQKNKSIHLEIMRIISVFWVIFIHTGEDGIFLFCNRPMGTPLFWVYLFVSVFCKFPVPLFLAVSGVVLLGREEEPLKTIYLKRILKIAVILLIFSLVYYSYNNFVTGEKLSLKLFLEEIYTKNIGHLWYLYLYITYLVALPFLRAIVRNLENKYFVYMLIVAVCLNGVVPVTEYIYGQGTITMCVYLKSNWLVGNAVLYPCLGYFLQNRLDRKRLKKALPWIIVLDFIGICVSCVMTYYRGIVTGEQSEMMAQPFHNCFVVLNCVAIFMIIRFVFENMEIEGRIKQIILSMGKCSFGIYLWHMMVLNQPFFVEWLKKIRRFGVNYMIAALMMCFVVMMISYLITLVQSKIPILRYLVGFK